MEMYHDEKFCSDHLQQYSLGMPVVGTEIKQSDLIPISCT